MITNDDNELLVLPLKIRVKKWFSAHKLHFIATISTAALMTVFVFWASAKVSTYIVEQFVTPLLK